MTKVSNLNPDQLLNLYNLTISRIEGNTQLRGMYTNYFLSVISAITGSIVIGISLLYKTKLIWFLIIGPIVNLTLCFLAIKICESCSRNFLEQITIAARLEKMIGLENLSEGSIIPEGWLSRQEDFYDPNFSTKDYVKKNLYKSSNKILLLVFLSMALISIALAVLVIIIGINPSLVTT